MSAKDNVKTKEKQDKYDELILAQQENIKKLEKEISMLKKNIEKYSETLSKSKKRNDEVGNSIERIFEGEEGKFRETLEKFSEILFDVGKYKENHVCMIYEKVIGELSLSRCRCKQATFNIDFALKSQKDEQRKEKHLKKIKETEPLDKQRFSKAQSALLASVVETEKAFHSLKEELESFDKQRVDELRAVLLAFTESELKYHSHALELYSRGFNMLRQNGRGFFL
jgi:tetratricopeptide (TPR) repeat protein